MALSSRQSRRDVLKLTAYSTAGALLGAPAVRAQTKSLTMMHESSFVPPYDAFFKNKLAAAYEKLTGIKVNYEVVSVGSLQTRVTTAAENSTGPDMTAIGFNWAFLFDDKFLDVSDIAAGDRQGKRRLVRVGAGIGGGQRQVEGHPVRQHRPADELAHRLVQAGGLRQVPRHLGRAPGGRHQAQEGRPSVRLRARPRLRRQSRLDLSAAVVLRRPRGRGRRQDHRHRFRRDGAGDRLLPPPLQGDHARGLPWLDRRQQQQGLPVRADLLHQQRRSRSCGRPSRTSPTWPR